jgi:hypothetical protein
MLDDSASVTKLNPAAHVKIFRERWSYARRQEQVAADSESFGELLETGRPKIEVIPDIQSSWERLDWQPAQVDCVFNSSAISREAEE